MRNESPPRRSSLTPRAMLPEGRIEWCYQTLELLKSSYARKETGDEPWAETLGEIERNRAREKVPEGSPYASRDAMLQAEIGGSEEEIVARQAVLRSQKSDAERTAAAEPLLEHGGDRKSEDRDQGSSSARKPVHITRPPPPDEIAASRAARRGRADAATA